MKYIYLEETYEPKGDIENFPLEVIEKMIENQVEQGNDPDVTLFEELCTLDKNGGGFDWSETQEEHDFWDYAICSEDFVPFFQRYPRTK